MRSRRVDGVSLCLFTTSVAILGESYALIVRGGERPKRYKSFSAKSSGGLAEVVARVLSPRSRVQLPGPPLVAGLVMSRRPPQLFSLVNKIKLWPSQNGILHGVEKVESLGQFIRVTTYCNKIILAKDSRRSRAARWLRNRWVVTVCRDCGIPEWKVRRFLKGKK